MTVTDTAVIVQLPRWLMHSHGLESRELIGTVQRSTSKAVLFRGTVNVRGTLHCLRCGRALEKQWSRDIGYGPDCCEHLGIPYEASEADARRVVQAKETELWLPLAKIRVLTLDGQVPDLAPEEPEAAATLMAVAGANIHVRTSFAHKDRVKSVNGARWVGARKTWVLPASPFTAAELMNAYQGLPVDVDSGFRALLEQGQAISADEGLRDADGDSLDDIPKLKTSAWGHQRRAFHFTRNMPAAMLAMDMGTGKSLVTVGKVGERASKPGDLTLIVCPLKATDVWPREFRRHAAYDVEVLQMASNSGKVKGTISQRLAQVEQGIELARALGKPIVIVINYDAVWRDSFSKWADKQTWQMVVLDESQKCKAPNGKASNYLAKIGRSAKNRLCLSGTPLANSPMDIYAQYRFLDPGIFGTSFARFRTRYAEMGGYGGYQVVGYKNQDELAKKIYSIGFKVGKEILDLPPEMDADPIEGPIGPDALKLYRQITDDLYALRDDGSEFTATNVLTRLLRQQQLTGGAINDDAGQTHTVDDAKAKLLQDLLEDTDPMEPVVVFVRFTHDADVVQQVAEATGRRYGELSGRRKDALNSDAEMNEDCDIVAVQIQSGGTGVDLTRARYCVYYSLGFSLTDYQQSRARVHRPGQTRPVTYYHLLASNVDVDRRVYAALESKEQVVNFIMNEMGQES